MFSSTKRRIYLSGLPSRGEFSGRISVTAAPSARRRVGGAGPAERSWAACRAAGRLSRDARRSRCGPEEKHGAFTDFFHPSISARQFLFPGVQRSPGVNSRRRQPTSQPDFSSRSPVEAALRSSPLLHSSPLPAPSRPSRRGQTWLSVGGSLACKGGCSFKFWRHSRAT